MTALKVTTTSAQNVGINGMINNQNNKTMDYEKLYNEALERMKSWMKGEHPECFSEAQKAAEFIFPELKESEDERIIRTLKEIVNWGCAKNISVENNVELKDCLAWLEKQKERSGLTKDEEFTLNRIIEHFEEEGGYDEWIEVLRDIRNIPYQKEQKPAELTYHDEVHRDSAIRYLESIKSPHDTAYQMKEEVIDWLKSIKPNHWKPSEEQMQALETAIRCRTMPWEQLESLYNDLKKL